MKRLLLSAAILSSMALFNVNAQELKTSADMKGSFKKNVVLEVFTAEWCGYCPGGKERIAKAIEMLDDEYKERVFQTFVHYNDGISKKWPRVGQLFIALDQTLGIPGFPTFSVCRMEKKGENLSIGAPIAIKNKIMKGFGDGTAPAEVNLKLTKGATPEDVCTA